jgi:hypothetical protein
MQIGKQNDYVNFRPKELIFSFLPVLPNFGFFGRITEVRPENLFFKKGRIFPYRYVPQHLEKRAQWLNFLNFSAQMAEN